MEKITRFVGLDVHGETIAAAIGEGRGKVRSLGQFPNRPESVRKFIDQVGGPQGLKVCYEAGPTGYALTGNSRRWAWNATSSHRR